MRLLRGVMAIATVLEVRDSCFSFHGYVHFPFRFSTFSEKMKKIYPLEASSNSVSFSSSFICAVVANAVLWKRWQYLKLFTQQTHFYRIWLRSFASVASPSPLPCQFFDIRVVFTLYLWNEVGDPHCFLLFWHKQLNLSDCSKKIKKSIDWKIFVRIP